LREVKRDGRVSIVGFGAFYQAVRKSRVGRNPQTGEVVKIAASRVPRFKAGKDFRDQIKKSRK
jgi:DNA-binding protein HU-beta